MWDLIFFLSLMLVPQIRHAKPKLHFLTLVDIRVSRSSSTKWNNQTNSRGNKQRAVDSNTCIRILFQFYIPIANANLRTYWSSKYSETFTIYAMPGWMVIRNVSLESSILENLIARVTSVLTRLHMPHTHVGSHIVPHFDAGSTD